MTEQVAEAVRALGGQSSSLVWNEVPDRVKDRTLLVLFDTLGVMIAGAGIPEVQAFAARHQESGSAPLAGLGRQSTAEASCWVNGTAVCSLELDEGSKYARGHPAAHVIPAALACGDNHDGSLWLSAVLAGYEVAARFGRSTQLHSGVHPHGTWGATGAATVAARLAGLHSDGIAAAIDAATGLSLAPHFESAFAGHPVRNLWVGAANVAGLAAARLAHAGNVSIGGTAAQTLGAILGTFDPVPLAVPFEERFEILGGYFKRHAACAYTHSAADAVLDLLGQAPLPVEEVDFVEVETYRIASTLNRIVWPTRLAAMFSIPFVVTVTLLEGAFGPTASDAAHRRAPMVGDLANRVNVVATDEFESRLPERRGARVSVHLRDGSLRSAEVDQPVGDASNQPFGWDEIRSKIGGLIGNDRAAGLERAVHNLEGRPIGSLLQTVMRS